MMQQNLEHLCVLVTGSSSGIGEAIARNLHKLGAFVILSGTNEQKLTAIKNDLGERSTFVIANLLEEGSAKKLVEQAERQSGKEINALVNNAGITRDKLAVRLSDKDWSDVMQVNLTSSFQLLKIVLRGMIRNRFGRIVSVASVVGCTGNVGQANYAATKAGLIGMSKSIAMEVAQLGITVNCVAPGFIATNMTSNLSEHLQEKIKSNIPMGRFGTVDDICPTVAYLVSNDSSYITGQTIHINGGMLMV